MNMELYFDEVIVRMKHHPEISSGDKAGWHLQPMWCATRIAGDEPC
jgi:hypothetical protein